MWTNKMEEEEVVEWLVGTSFEMTKKVIYVHNIILPCSKGENMDHMGMLHAHVPIIIVITRCLWQGA